MGYNHNSVGDYANTAWPAQAVGPVGLWPYHFSGGRIKKIGPALACARLRHVYDRSWPAARALLIVFRSSPVPPTNHRILNFQNVLLARRRSYGGLFNPRGLSSGHFYTTMKQTMWLTVIPALPASNRAR